MRKRGGGAADILLRATTEFDLDWVLRIERAPGNEPFVTQWPRSTHSAALRDSRVRHLLAVNRAGERLAFAILRGVGDPEPNLELMRIVVAEPGAGTGRAVLRMIMSMAFEELGAHRLWLDVVTTNERARALYRSEGFVEEGVLREAARKADGYASLVLMSLLESEYRAE